MTQDNSSIVLTCYALTSHVCSLLTPRSLAVRHISVDWWQHWLAACDSIECISYVYVPHPAGSSALLNGPAECSMTRQCISCWTMRNNLSHELEGQPRRQAAQPTHGVQRSLLASRNAGHSWVPLGPIRKPAFLSATMAEVHDYPAG